MKNSEQNRGQLKAEQIRRLTPQDYLNEINRTDALGLEIYSWQQVRIARMRIERKMKFKEIAEITGVTPSGACGIFERTMRSVQRTFSKGCYFGDNPKIPDGHFDLGHALYYTTTDREIPPYLLREVEYFLSVCQSISSPTSD